MEGGKTCDDIQFKPQKCIQYNAFGQDSLKHGGFCFSSRLDFFQSLKHSTLKEAALWIVKELELKVHFSMPK